MCQVNTDPMTSRKGYLQVVGECFSTYIILVIISQFILLKDFLLNGLFNFSYFIVDGCHVTNG